MTKGNITKKLAKQIDTANSDSTVKAICVKWIDIYNEAGIPESDNEAIDMFRARYPELHEIEDSIILKANKQLMDSMPELTTILHKLQEKS